MVVVDTRTLRAARLPAGPRPLSHLQLLPGAGRVLSLTYSGDLTVWDAASHARLYAHHTAVTPSRALAAFRRAGAAEMHLFILGKAHRLHGFALAADGALQPLPPLPCDSAQTPITAVAAVGCTRGGTQYLALGLESGTIAFYDAFSGAYAVDFPFFHKAPEAAPLRAGASTRGDRVRRAVDFIRIAPFPGPEPSVWAFSGAASALRGVALDAVCRRSRTRAPLLIKTDSQIVSAAFLALSPPQLLLGDTLGRVSVWAASTVTPEASAGPTGGSDPESHAYTDSLRSGVLATHIARALELSRGLGQALQSPPAHTPGLEIATVVAPLDELMEFHHRVQALINGLERGAQRARTIGADLPEQHCGAFAEFLEAAEFGEVLSRAFSAFVAGLVAPRDALASGARVSGAQRLDDAVAELTRRLELSRDIVEDIAVGEAGPSGPASPAPAAPAGPSEPDDWKGAAQFLIEQNKALLRKLEEEHARRVRLEALLGAEAGRPARGE